MTVYRYPKAQDAVDWFMEYRRGLGPCEPTLVESV